jgi:Family of unknown function (DUF6301)
VDTWHALDPAAVADLLTTLRQHRWNWSTTELPQLTDRLGWTITVTLEGKGAFADTPSPLGGRDVQFTFTDDHVDEITVRVTDRVLPKTGPSQEFMQDTFAALVKAGTDALGEPTGRILGDNPQVRWCGDDTTIALMNTGVAVSVIWATNDAQNHWDRIRGISA